MTTAPTWLSDDDLHLFGEGTHHHLHRVLGAHPDGDGTWFAVWAPNARDVRLLGDRHGWQATEAPRLDQRGVSGVWEIHVPGAGPGDRYKYGVLGADGRWVDKADPFAAAAEEPPATASVVAELSHDWADGDWMERRGALSAPDAPLSVYEVHLGSWTAGQSDRGRFADYRLLAERLADHVIRNGFTHVELLPVMEHPFYGSWGYQTTGFFAPTARYGSPTDFMWMVDHLHQRGIGVICDWVPSHFPGDEHGLAWFDGTALFEHLDPRLGHHPDWDSKIFNYSRNEVRSFLISSAICWLERYHVDGLRVDAVASMLYRDYSRREGEWIPNEHGGRENLEAIGFLRQLTTAVRRHHPDVTTFAEESTAWPGVTASVDDGGLGFHYKWDMGWMHDTLHYLEREPVHRRYHHGEITFRGVYAFSERYVLPLSHDEVVHGKGSLRSKMPGDDWQRLANLRLLLGLQWTTPGKKLLFMGGEIGQHGEWDHESTIDWSLLEYPDHEGVRRLVADLNDHYRNRPALHRLDTDPAGFRWVALDDADNSVLSWLRTDGEGDVVLVVANLTPVVRPNHRTGVPDERRWQRLFCTDAVDYGGSGAGDDQPLSPVPVPFHGFEQSVMLTLAPLAVTVYEPAPSHRAAP